MPWERKGCFGCLIERRWIRRRVMFVGASFVGSLRKGRELENVDWVQVTSTVQEMSTMRVQKAERNSVTVETGKLEMRSAERK